jgi:hypothetical protein
VTAYVSPYGKPRGLPQRLAAWPRRISSTEEYRPWLGTGIIEDLKLAAAILNRREWLEKLRLSDDPAAQQFAAELLDDIDELETVECAAANVNGLPDAPYALPGVETIEKLDARAVGLDGQLTQIREMLVSAGVLEEGDDETDLAALLRALLA